MSSSIVSGVIKISKDVINIENELPRIFGGEVIRWAIVDVTDEAYTIICSYKK